MNQDERNKLSDWMDSACATMEAGHKVDTKLAEGLDIIKKMLDNLNSRMEVLENKGVK